MRVEKTINRAVTFKLLSDEDGTLVAVRVIVDGHRLCDLEPGSKLRIEMPESLDEMDGYSTE